MSIKPGTPVVFIDYMERKHPALVMKSIDDFCDLVVFQEEGEHVRTVLARSVGLSNVRGSRYELIE